MALFANKKGRLAAAITGYSVLSAITGSRLAARADGISPATSVSITLIATSINPATGGSAAPRLCILVTYNDVDWNTQKYRDSDADCPGCKANDHGFGVKHTLDIALGCAHGSQYTYLLGSLEH